MGYDISALKKMSAELGTKNIIKSEEKKSYGDDRFWKPEFDKGGEANAIIRLLPSLDPNSLPWIQTEKYFFKGPSGQWYINNSRRMLGEADPMYEYTRELYSKASTDEEKKEIKRYYPNRKFVCNALVVKDPAHPENEGRVVLFEFGKIIHNKIIEKLKPTFEGDVPVNVFDWVNGANLRLRIYREGGFPRYDRCEFASPSAIPDEKIAMCAEKMYNLQEFFDPKNFRSYDDLKRRIAEVFLLNTDTDKEFESKPKTVMEEKKVASTNELGVKAASPVSKKSEDWSAIDSIDDLDFDKMMSDV